MTKQKNSKLWGGRFEQATDLFVEKFTASVEFDKRLYQYDIQGSIAHAAMLAHIGIISEIEYRQIESGLVDIKHEIENNRFDWQIALEDVHMNIESRLIEKIGEVGKKLHTARSRNDQVALDMRLYLRDEIDLIQNLMTSLLENILEVAQREVDTIMPGFTHLQIAQPVTFGHHMMAWFESLRRDLERLIDCRKRVNVLSLGAGALAGTSYPIDRSFVAKLLNFDDISRNSMDTVSDRDFILEAIFVAAVCMSHLSRMSEELVLWSSTQFNFIDLGDRFCTGSSIMPQKKNPDVPELVRGKAGRVNGALVSILTLIKGQPLAYNKDNQEDKEPLFDTVDTLKACLKVFADMIPAMQVKKKSMREAAGKGYSTATDYADYLVRKGIAFREAHEIVGKTVRHAISLNCELAQLELKDFLQFTTEVESDVYDVLTLEGSINSRNHIGGTSPKQVQAAINYAKKWLKTIE